MIAGEKADDRSDSHCSEDEARFEIAVLGLHQEPDRQADGKAMEDDSYWEVCVMMVGMTFMSGMGRMLARP